MKYYELETPIIVKSEKNVVKLFKEHGRFQVFPRVLNTKHGIGRGATLDLTLLDEETLKQLKLLMNEAIEYQFHIRSLSIERGLEC